MTKKKTLHFVLPVLKAAEAKSLSAQSSVKGDTFTHTGFSYWPVKRVRKTPNFKRSYGNVSWSNKSESEVVSNFHQLLLLRWEDDEMLSNWLSRRTEKYTSPEIQNEMIEVMSLWILQNKYNQFYDYARWNSMHSESSAGSDMHKMDWQGYLDCSRRICCYETHGALYRWYVCSSDTLNQMNLNLKNARG